MHIRGPQVGSRTHSGEPLLSGRHPHLHPHLLHVLATSITLWCVMLHHHTAELHTFKHTWIQLNPPCWNLQISTVPSSWVWLFCRYAESVGLTQHNDSRHDSRKFSRNWTSRLCKLGFEKMHFSCRCVTKNNNDFHMSYGGWTNLITTWTVPFLFTSERQRVKAWYQYYQ